MRRLNSEHAIAAAVAVGALALAMAEGGFAPTAFAATGIVAWTAVIVGLVLGVLPRAEPPRPAMGAGLCLVALAALTAISIAWAGDDGGAFEDAVKVLAYLGIFALVVLVSRPGEAGPWLRGLAIALTLTGAVALLARYVPSLFGSPDAEIAERLPATLGRLTYPIGYWNAMAASMAMAIVLLAWNAGSGRTRAGRALAVAALPVPVLALWMTQSRGGVVLAVAGLALFLLLARPGPRTIAGLLAGAVASAILIAVAELHDELLNDPVAAAGTSQGGVMLAVTVAVVVLTGLVARAGDDRVGSLRLPRGAGRAGGFVLVGLAVIALIAIGNPVDRFEEFKAPPSVEELADGEVGLLRGGGSGRYQFWEAAVAAFGEAPVGGLGASGYGPYWLEHRELEIPATRAHSLLLESLAELGIGGLALVVALFGIVLVTAVRRLRRQGAPPELAPAVAVFAVGIASLAIDWTWDVPATALVCLGAAGLLTGPATLGRRWRETDPPDPDAVGRRRRFAGGVALLLLAWLSVCAAGVLLLGDHALESSRDQSVDGQLERAIESANDAIDLQPWAAEPRTQLALLLEKAGDVEGARETIAEAIDRADRDYELYLVAARLDAEVGDDAAARRNVERAAELNPLDPLVRYASGILDDEGG